MVQPPDLAPVSFGSVRGANRVKRALIIAAAGLHRTLLIVPPGSHTLMLARKLHEILPEASNPRPWRAPHYRVSCDGLSSEFNLARGGILYCEDLPAFRYTTLRRLEAELSRREPPLLIATATPCPCGPQDLCRCTPSEREGHRQRVAALAVDFDIAARIDRLDGVESSRLSDATSVDLRRRVSCAHALQRARYRGCAFNGTLSDDETAALVPIRGATAPRRPGPVARVARTLADLRGDPAVSWSDTVEAQQLCWGC